jgi:hypothetical protein
MTIETTTLAKKSLRYCWGSIALLPVATLAMTGGPCGGPNGAVGSALLFFVGSGSISLSGFGIVRALQVIREKTGGDRVWTAFSMLCAGFAGLVGGFLAFIGAYAFYEYVRY